MSAEDVASEVFLQLMGLSSLCELRQPRAMMATIARRVMFEIQRRDGLRRAYEADLCAFPEELVSSPEEQAIVREALRSVDRVLSRLSPKCRAAFLYSRVDGMKRQEISEKLNVSVRTVERYLADGMRAAIAIKLEHVERR